MRFHVHTRYPLAASSVDHLHPRGTKNDNSTNLHFNDRLFGLLDGRRRPIVLDLGCSGGGFVKSLNDAGAIAIGIEGSDYSKNLGRAAWGEIPEMLFTADIGRPFLVLNEDECLFSSFDVATAWEVLEHLDLDQLETLNLTLHAHLDLGGLLIASINSAQDHFEGIDYHATVRPPLWWAEFFVARGWTIASSVLEYFGNQWVRGPNTDGAASTCFVFQK